jgi:predicted transcriptional regulator
MRHQFVLDKKTNEILRDLASGRGGNRSMVVREAIRYYADMEEHLERMESDPAFQKMIAQSEADIRAGRVTAHSEVKRMSRALAKKRK